MTAALAWLAESEVISPERHRLFLETDHSLLAIGGVFDIGSLGAYLLYVKQVSQPVGQISQQINTLLAAAAGAERITPVIALNKSDLAVPFERASKRLEPYRRMGYRVLPMSLKVTRWSSSMKKIEHFAESISSLIWFSPRFP